MRAELHRDWSYGRTRAPTRHDAHTPPLAPREARDREFNDISNTFIPAEATPPHGGFEGMVGQQRRGIGLVLIIAFALVAVAATPALAYDPGDDDLTIAPPCPTTTQSSSPTLSFCTNNDDSNICNDQMKKSDTNNIGPLTINTVRVQVYICVDREYTDTGDYTCDFYAHWTADGYLPITESNHVESPVEYEYHGKLKRSSDQADRLDTIIKEGTEPGPVHQYNEERWTLQPGEGGVSKAEIQRTDPLGGFSHSAHATVQRTC